MNPLLYFLKHHIPLNFRTSRFHEKRTSQGWNFLSGFPSIFNFFSAKKIFIRKKKNFEIKKVFFHHFFLSNFDWKKWVLMKIKIFHIIFWWEHSLKTLKIDDLYIKIIISLNQFCKKNSPSGGPPTGSRLKRRACLRRPAVRGLKRAKKPSKIRFFGKIWF